jgi:hypothetical protein
MRDDLVVADAQPPAIRVTRYANCPTLSGTVHAQAGNSNGVVLVVSDSDHIEPEIVPFGDGRFQTNGLIPGTYHVYAFSMTWSTPAWKLCANIRSRRSASKKIRTQASAWSLFDADRST